jgi:hypothetical protein
LQLDSKSLEENKEILSIPTLKILRISEHPSQKMHQFWTNLNFTCVFQSLKVDFTGSKVGDFSSWHIYSSDHDSLPGP